MANGRGNGEDGSGILRNDPGGNEEGMGSDAAEGQGGNPRRTDRRNPDVLAEVMEFLGTRIPICGTIRAKVEANIAFGIQIAQREFRENHSGK